ncbi:MAG: phosphoglycolate phosphatase [Pseudomonadota bacterium]|nr:phosphoglycolate phosphatase [Pseudomonadota bacterium]
MSTSLSSSPPSDALRLPIDACIVDLDGTMVDTLGDFEVALNAMLAALGRGPVTRAEIERLVGKGSENLIRSVLALTDSRPAQPGQAVAPADVAQGWPLYQQAYLRCNGQHSAVYPGVAAGLQALRDAGLPLACLTNKPLAFARPLLVAKGLDGFFSHVFGGDSFARKKPDPLPLLETCRALGTEPARTLMLGDSSNDAAAARAAGCPVVLLTYGYNHGQPVQAVDADGHLPAMTELPAWLAARAARGG